RTHISQIQIERILFAIGVEGSLIQSICPRRQEGDSTHPAAALVLFYRSKRKSEYLLSLHSHIEGAVSVRRHDGNCGLRPGVLQTNDLAFAPHGVLSERG